MKTFFRLNGLLFSISGLLSLAFATCPEKPTELPKAWMHAEFEDCQNVPPPAKSRFCNPNYTPKAEDNNRFAAARLDTNNRHIICYYNRDDGKGDTFAIVSKMSVKRSPHKNNWPQGLFVTCPDAASVNDCPFSLNEYIPPKPKVTVDPDTIDEYCDEEDCLLQKGGAPKGDSGFNFNDL